MENSTSHQWDRWLFHVIWIWIALRTMLPWLVSFRLTLEGDGYSWGSEYFGRMFHSTGLSRPDVLLVYVLLAVGIVLLLGLRRHRLPLYAPLTVAYLAVFAANALYQLLRGEPVIFQGETLGVELNITVVFFVLQFGMFLIALLWWYGVRDVREGPGSGPISGRRRALLKLAALIIPIQIVLLVIGEPHALTDEIGVILTLANWVLLCGIFYPDSNYRRQPVASEPDAHLNSR